MKSFKWKIYIITSIVCILPILAGALLWNKLPDEMAIHFNIYGVADGFATKGVVVFGLPIFMVLMQAVVCFANDLSMYQREERSKFEKVAKWIIPCMTLALQAMTLGIGLGYKINVQKFVMILMGVLFIVMGYFLPEYDRVKNFKMSPEKAKKVNKFMGRGLLVLGIIFLVGAFFKPNYAIASVLLVIPFSIISIIYALIIQKRP